MAMSNIEFQQRWNQALTSNYGSPTIALNHGVGIEVWDVQGNRYLDFLGGIATNILGHVNPEIVAAITNQAGKLTHISNFYMHEGVIALAEKLKEMAGDPTARVFLCNSGAEANEAALKLSRLTGKKHIVATHGAFHGRTMGALSLTGQPAKRNPFKPLLKSVDHVPFGDIPAMRKAVTRRTAMVILEPILGEHGVVVPPDGYLKAVRQICTNKGALLVIDAVQTGMGRTGNWFGFEHEGIVPDVITLAKGLGGGLPLGAMIALGDAGTLFQPGQHGTTFGGNPIACAAAIATIEVIERDQLLVRTQEHEIEIKSSLSVLPGVVAVRGRGLLLGVVFADEIATTLYPKFLAAGLLVNAANSHVIRIAPALTVTTVQVAEFIELFSRVVTEFFEEANGEEGNG